MAIGHGSRSKAARKMHKMRLELQRDFATTAGDAGDAEQQAEDPKVRWARETRAAIDFEEDPHAAAALDNPELVLIGPRTWAAIFVSDNDP